MLYARTSVVQGTLGSLKSVKTAIGDSVNLRVRTYAFIKNYSAQVCSNRARSFCVVCVQSEAESEGTHVTLHLELFTWHVRLADVERGCFQQMMSVEMLNEKYNSAMSTLRSATQALKNSIAKVVECVAPGNEACRPPPSNTNARVGPVTGFSRNETLFW